MAQAVTDQDFAEKVENAKGLVLVDMWAAWCPPCRALAPIIEQLDEEEKDVAVYKLDVDANPEVSQRFRVSSIPTVMLFKDGEPVRQMIGLQPKAAYQAAIRDSA